MVLAVQVAGRICQAVSLSRASSARAPLPQLPSRPVATRRQVVRVQASSQKDVQAEMTTALALGTAASTLLASGNAQAAMEMAQIGAGDGRLGILLTLFVPVIGWVLFNMAGPIKNQLDNMQKAVPVGLGLTAAGLVAAGSADAAAEVAQLAEGDSRLGILLTLFVPVIGWVLFNMAGPIKNQLDNMQR